MEYDVNPEVLIAAEADLVLIFASQMLDPKSASSGNSEVEAAATGFTDEMAALLAGKKATVWKLSPELDGTQVVPDRILHFLSNLYENYWLYQICQHNSLSMCSLVRTSGQYLAEAEAFLAHECRRLGVWVQRSRICHEKAGSELFACRKFGERDTVESYYRSLAYGVLEKESQFTEEYEEKCLKVTAESSWRWT